MKRIYLLLAVAIIALVSCQSYVSRVKQDEKNYTKTEKRLFGLPVWVSLEPIISTWKKYTDKMGNIGMYTAMGGAVVVVISFALSLSSADPFTQKTTGLIRWIGIALVVLGFAFMGMAKLWVYILVALVAYYLWAKVRKHKDFSLSKYLAEMTNGKPTIKKG